MADAGHPLAADQSSYDLSQRYFGVNPVAWLSDCACRGRKRESALNGHSRRATRPSLRHARNAARAR